MAQVTPKQKENQLSEHTRNKPHVTATVSPEVRAELQRREDEGGSRSKIIELALRKYFGIRDTKPETEQGQGTQVKDQKTI